MPGGNLLIGDHEEPDPHRPYSLGLIVICDFICVYAALLMLRRNTLASWVQSTRKMWRKMSIHIMLQTNANSCLEFGLNGSSASAARMSMTPRNAQYQATTFSFYLARQNVFLRVLLYL
jgi:hypothetical protein